MLQTHADEWKTLVGWLVLARQALDEVIRSDTVDESLIRQRHADLAAVEADAAVVRACVRADIVQLLTSEQQTRLRERRHHGRF